MNRSRVSALPGWLAGLSWMVALAVLGCSSPPARPVPLATPPPPAEAPPPSPEPAPPPAAPEAEKRPEADKLTVVIEEEAPPVDRPMSLLEASRLAKEQKKNAQPPIAVITNANLAQYAKRGNLTVGGPSTKTPEADKPTEGEAGSDKPGKAGDEAYWRQRGLEIRQRWREAYDQISELERQAETYRFKFYSERDIRVRDGEIKPAWDRVLEQLERARTDVEKAKDELDTFLEEGRQAGALQGWLREGSELEPEEQEEPKPGDLKTAEPGEPVVIDQRL